MAKRKSTPEYKFKTDVERRATCTSIIQGIQDNSKLSIAEVCALNGITRRLFNSFLRRKGFGALQRKYNTIYEGLVKKGTNKVTDGDKKRTRYSKETKLKKCLAIIEGYQYTNKTFKQLYREQKINSFSFGKWVIELDLVHELEVCKVMSKSLNKEYDYTAIDADTQIIQAIKTFSVVCKYYVECIALKIPTVINSRGEQLYKWESGFLTLVNCCIKAGTTEKVFYGILAKRYEQIEGVWEDTKIVRKEMIRLARETDVQELMDLSRIALRDRMVKRKTFKTRTTTEKKIDKDGNKITVDKEILDEKDLEVDLATIQYSDKITGMAPKDKIELEGNFQHLHLHTTDQKQIEEDNKEAEEKVRKLQSKKNTFRDKILGTDYSGIEDVLEQDREDVDIEGSDEGGKSLDTSKIKKYKKGFQI